MGAIADILMPRLLRASPGSQNGGTLANKPGYHNTRKRLLAQGRSADYSISQYQVDREGSGDLEAAFDWTFPSAQRGDFREIAKFSERFLAAGRRGRVADPRTKYLREFYGNADLDREVEGWDYAAHRAASSDDSHVWHLHGSVHRKYANDPVAMDAIASIAEGESVAAYLHRTARKVTTMRFATTFPVLKQGDDDSRLPGYDTIGRLQRIVGATPDGIWGPNTTSKIAAYCERPAGECKVLTESIVRKVFGLPV